MSKKAISSIGENGGLIRAAGKTLSTQKPTDSVAWDGGEILEPPYPPEEIAVVYEKNTTARKCIDLYTMNVFGAGYTIKTYSGNTESDEYKKANEFFSNINPEKSFEELCQSFTLDYKNIGYAGFEIARNKITKLPDKVFDIPIGTVRVAKGSKAKGFVNGQRFIQNEGSGNGKVYFNKYVSNPEERNEANGFDPELNEIMWMSTPNPSSRYYGLSPSITLLQTYLLAIYCQSFNIDAFESGMLNKFMILLNGNANLSSDSVAGLRAFMQENNSKEKWSTIPILKAMGENAKIEIAKVSSDVIESSFIETLKFTREEVYIAFGVPPVLLGIMENSTQANQNAQMKKFYVAEVRPIEKMIESRFNKMLKDDLGLSDIYIEANEPDFGDKKISSDIAKDQVDRGVISINEWRNLEDKDPIEGGNEAFLNTNIGIVLVKDIPKLTSEMYSDQQSSKVAQAMTDSLLNFKRQKEEELRRKKILDGTEESDDEYPKPE